VRKGLFDNDLRGVEFRLTFAEWGVWRANLSTWRLYHNYIGLYKCDLEEKQRSPQGSRVLGERK